MQKVTKSAVIKEVPVDQIQAGDNDRKKFDLATLTQLSQSIEANGLAQPITIRPTAKDSYEIVAGERRFRAMRDILKANSIRCIVEPMDDKRASSIMLTENLGRVDLSPVEEAKAYSKRMESGQTIDQLAIEAGVSEDRIKKRTSLLNLFDIAQQMVDAQQFPIGHAEQMVKLDENRQRIAFRIYVNSGKGLALHAFRDICQQLQDEQDQDALFEMEEFFLTATEQDISERGKFAKTGAPSRADLPDVEVSGCNDTTGAIFDRYIANLLTQGLEAEAATIGKVYNALVRSNFVKVPTFPLLIQGTEK